MRKVAFTTRLKENLHDALSDYSKMKDEKNSWVVNKSIDFIVNRNGVDYLRRVNTLLVKNIKAFSELDMAEKAYENKILADETTYHISRLEERR